MARCCVRWAAAPPFGAAALATALLPLGGCRDEPRPREQSGVVPPAAAPAVAPPAAAEASAAEFRALRWWLEGTWRGSGAGLQPFFEEYRLADDSTLVIHYLADSTLARTADTGTLELRQGRLFHTAGQGRWVATRLDSTAVHFAPVRGASNRFVWSRESPAVWTATLYAGGGATGERRFRMKRVAGARAQR